MSGPRGVQPSWRGWAWLGQAPAGLFRVLEVGWGQLSGTPGLVSPLTWLQIASRILLPCGLVFPQVLWAWEPDTWPGAALCSLSLFPTPTPHPPALPPITPILMLKLVSLWPSTSCTASPSLWRPISPGSIRKGPGA